jgi:TIR domain
MVSEDAKGLEFDAFISYETEDQLTVVEPLVRQLEARGIRVWYDKAMVAPGESLRREIDKGLLGSRVGIPILSRRYFEKQWTQGELDALLELHRQGRIEVIPVRHGMTHAELSECSPLLSGRRSLSTDVEITVLADDIAATIRLEWLHRATLEVAMPNVPVLKTIRARREITVPG